MHKAGLTKLPFYGPVADVRIARIAGNWVLNPRKQDVDDADIDLLVSGTSHTILAVEGDMLEIGTMEIIEALTKAQEAIKILCQLQDEIFQKADRKTSWKYSAPQFNKKLRDKLFDWCYPKIREILDTPVLSYDTKKAEIDSVKNSFVKIYRDKFSPWSKYMVKDLFSELKLHMYRNHILEKQERLDGRKNHELRLVYIERNFVASIEGGVFYAQGDTQIIATAWIENFKEDSGIPYPKDAPELSYTFNFRSKINTTNTKPLGNMGRRQIAYSNFVVRTLKRVIKQPIALNEYQQPYVETAILQSNGSSSVACIQAASLALQEARVAQTPIAAVSIGILIRGQSHVILVDLLNDEEGISDIIIKVAGTKFGIVGLQLINKRKFNILNTGVLIKALKESRVKINEILLNMSILGIDH